MTRPPEILAAKRSAARPFMRHTPKRKTPAKGSPAFPLCRILPAVLLALFLLTPLSATTGQPEVLCFTQRVTDAPSFHIYTGRNDANNPIVWSHTIPAGILKSVVRVGLYIEAWDVDYPQDGDEYDRVYFNGHDLGLLEGFNNTWITVEKTVPVEALREGVNDLKVFVDEAQKEWKVTIRASELRFYCSAPDPDFSIGATPAAREIIAGQAADFTVTVIGLNDFTSPVGLRVEGLPTETSAQFTPNPVTPDPSATGALRITTTTAVVPGEYPLTIHGSGGEKMHQASVTLTVKPRPPEADFRLALEPAALTLHRGGSAQATVTATAINGFAAAVALRLEGVPAGLTAGFLPDSITPAPTAASALNFTAAADLAAGTYNLTLFGRSADGREHTLPLSVTVVCNDFTVGVSARPALGPAPLAVQFTATMEAAAGSPAAVPAGTRYAWDFGDGSQVETTVPTAAHTYTVPGLYTAAVSVSGDCGLVRRAQCPVDVHGLNGSLSLQFQPAETYAGKEVELRVTAANTTRLAFADVLVQVDLPPPLRYVGDDSGVSPALGGNRLSWRFPVLDKNAQTTFTVRLAVAADAAEGLLTVPAAMLHASLGNGQSIQAAPAALRILGLTVLLGKQVSRADADPGQSLEYRLTVKNNSAVDLHNLRLTDRLDSGLQFVSAAPATPFRFTRKSDECTWQADTLAAGQEVLLVLQARLREDLRAGTVVPNLARLEAAELRTAVLSNTVRTVIQGEPVNTGSVQFSQRPDLPQSEVGRVVRIRLRVVNASQGALLAPVIEEQLPQGFQYVAGSSLWQDQPFADPRGGRHLAWELPAIRPGETAELRFQAVIGADATRGRNVLTALLQAFDNTNRSIRLQAEALVEVSSGGFQFTATLDGSVFLDRDDDEFLSPADTPLSGIEVRLSNGRQASSDSQGRFLFENLNPGEYTVGVNRATLPEKYRMSSPLPRVVSLADGLSDTVDFPVRFGAQDETQPARLEGRVFFDKNRNRVFDGDDPLHNEFSARLDGSMETRGKNGRFVFTHLKEGAHKLEIVYNGKTVTMAVTLKKGANTIDVPLPFSGIVITVKGEQ